MRTLPYDYHRCEATEPDDKCRSCLRRADMPGQTAGPRTPWVSRKNSADEHCTYIPVEEQKQ